MNVEVGDNDVASARHQWVAEFSDFAEMRHQSIRMEAEHVKQDSRSCILPNTAPLANQQHERTKILRRKADKDQATA